MHMYYIAIALLIVALICCSIKKKAVKCIGIILCVAAVVCGSVGLFAGYTIDVTGLVHNSATQEEALIAPVEPVDAPLSEAELEHVEVSHPAAVEPEVSSPEKPQQQPVHTNTNKQSEVQPVVAS